MLIQVAGCGPATRIPSPSNQGRSELWLRAARFFCTSGDDGHVIRPGSPRDSGRQAARHIFDPGGGNALVQTGRTVEPQVSRGTLFVRRCASPPAVDSNAAEKGVRPGNADSDDRQRRELRLVATRFGQISHQVEAQCGPGTLRQSGRRTTRRAILRRHRVRICRLIGTSPRNGTSSSSARRRAPPLPKISCLALHCVQTKWLMFSTIPSTLMFTFLNMAIALVASISATSCGVQTTTAPAKGSSCERVRTMSPVPGGRSDHEIVEIAPASCREGIAEIAPCNIGPRQMTASSGGTKNPHRHDFQAARFDGRDSLVVYLGPLIDAQQMRNAGPVDVGVHETDFASGPLESKRQTSGDRTLFRRPPLPEPTAMTLLAVRPISPSFSGGRD